MEFDVEYFEYECGICCTPIGCCGHTAYIPIAIVINGGRFAVDGAMEGDNGQRI